MPDLTLVIGSRTYSPWSLCAWILAKHLGVEFREVQLRQDTPDFKDAIARYGPNGHVPVLQDGALTIWNSLAICEYLAELTGKGWPADRAARAYARSVCAEIHSGFINLRTEWPMNARARNRVTPMTPGLETDIERIDEIWIDCRRRFGARNGGPWLFGEYGIADAMSAPAVLRFNTYRATMISGTTRWYIATALEDAHMQQWVSAAQNEPWTNPNYEVGSKTYDA
jgi:glutathione S-transferase